jgi:uncharacterized repeat protein (TIGR03803 family)
MKTKKLTKKGIEAGINRRTLTWIFSAAVALGLLATPMRGQLPGIFIYTTNQTTPTSFTASLAVFTDTSSLGTNQESFAWYFNTNLIPGATNYILNIFDAQASNAGSYSVVVSDTFGAVTSSPPMTLTVTNISFELPSVQFSTLASFNQFVDGAFPQAGLIQASDGYLYGTTLAGGTNAGATDGTVFKMSTDGVLAWSVAFNDADGQAPAAGLVQAGDGNLYGTTGYGGTKGFGTVFQITTNGVLTSIYSFDPGQSDGGFPEAPLCVGLDGYLYGTTTTNGSDSLGGTIFKMSTNGGSLVWSYSFAEADGNVPLAGVVQGLDGSLYGTASEGGAFGAGSVFSITTNGVFTNLYSFTDVADGGYPYGGLAQGPDSQLYGTTTDGGDTNLNDGTIFKITTNGTFTVVLAFEGTNGALPEASMIVAGDGNLYGTTKGGGIGAQFGADNLYPPTYGTIFQLTTNGGLVTLISFDGNYDGAAPHSSLWQGVDGGLYGTTSQGGTNDLDVSLPSLGDGTVFRLGVVRPTIISEYVVGNTFYFTWIALPGVPYQTQYNDNPGQSPWIDFGGTVVGTNGFATQSDTIGATNTARFYRVSLQF